VTAVTTVAYVAYVLRILEFAKDANSVEMGQKPVRRAAGLVKKNLPAINVLKTVPNIVKLLGLGFDFTFTCQGENHCNPWIKPLQPLDKTTATQNPHLASIRRKSPTHS